MKEDKDGHTCRRLKGELGLTRTFDLSVGPKSVKVHLVRFEEDAQETLLTLVENREHSLVRNLCLGFQNRHKMMKEGPEGTVEACVVQQVTLDQPEAFLGLVDPQGREAQQKRQFLLPDVVEDHRTLGLENGEVTQGPHPCGPSQRKPPSIIKNPGDQEPRLQPGGVLPDCSVREFQRLIEIVKVPQTLTPKKE